LGNREKSTTQGKCVFRRVGIIIELDHERIKSVHTTVVQCTGYVCIYVYTLGAIIGANFLILLILLSKAMTAL